MMTTNEVEHMLEVYERMCHDLRGRIEDLPGQFGEEDVEYLENVVEDLNECLEECNPEISPDTQQESVLYDFFETGTGILYTLSEFLAGIVLDTRRREVSNE